MNIIYYSDLLFIFEMNKQAIECLTMNELRNSEIT